MENEYLSIFLKQRYNADADKALLILIISHQLPHRILNSANPPVTPTVALTRPITSSLLNVQYQWKVN
jgi:hypothetical protein